MLLKEGQWEDAVNRKAFLKWFADQRKFDAFDPLPWYSITISDILATKVMIIAIMEGSGRIEEERWKRGERRKKLKERGVRGVREGYERRGKRGEGEILIILHRKGNRS